jgi:hypothetical protein
VSFHVEVKRGFHSARMFNLDERELLHRVLEPWSRGSRFEFGGREWDPAESSLRVLEGRTLDPPELAHGQGWNAAEKVARDVTRQALSSLARQGADAASAVGVVGAHAAAREAVGSALEQLGLSPVAWTGNQRPEGVAVVVVVVAADSHLGAAEAFEAGVARGAFGDRAIFVQLGDASPPPELAGTGIIRFEPGNAEALRVLAERLRTAGCAVR